MNKQILIIRNLLIISFLPIFCFSQDKMPLELSELFLSDEVLSMKLSYSNRDLKKETNDSTFINTFLKFRTDETEWDSLDVRLRKRGNFRLRNCFYAPVKLKIKKKKAEGTLFESHKNLKLVLPCKTEKFKNDYILKEYLAYKMYEVISPYHFKARLVNLEYEELKNKKSKTHNLLGILVEDDKHVAKRIGGKVWDRKVHPLNQLDQESVRNAFFQFMIANTDFSNAYSHNAKLFYLENQIIPVPYDFDMSGLVDASYSVVSLVSSKPLDIENVTDRLYRGFIRNPTVYTEIRLEYLANRLALLAEIEKCKSMFEDPFEYNTTIEFINKFFEIITDDNKYKKWILDKARTK